MKPWLDSAACRNRAHCRDCRTDALFQARVSAPEICPHGITAATVPAAVLAAGPGTELKRLLAKLGITESIGCGCAALAAQMDRWGPDGCQEHLEELVTALDQAAHKRQWLRLLPFKKAGARQLIRRAITAARKSAARSNPFESNSASKSHRTALQHSNLPPICQDTNSAKTNPHGLTPTYRRALTRKLCGAWKAAANTAASAAPTTHAGARSQAIHPATGKAAR